MMKVPVLSCPKADALSGTWLPHLIKHERTCHTVTALGCGYDNAKVSERMLREKGVGKVPEEDVEMNLIK